MIETLDLFPELTKKLVKLLKSIRYDEWNKPSPLRGRTVKDLVSHLIDGSLRRLSLQRDAYSSSAVKVNIETYGDQVDYIQKLNRDWMDITDRLSPRILIDLLEYAEKELFEFFKILDPKGKAIFSVAWAGEEESENWADIAREYTEKWHHQMQIRIALNKPLLMDLKYIEPLYDTFMLGLPHLYNEMADYPDGERIRVTITGNLDKTWNLRKEGKWVLDKNADFKSHNVIEFPENLAWIVFTNTDRNKEAYKSKMSVQGDKKLGYKLLDFVAVMS
jgi:hypothetical protein